jgi:HrpA-like RNA helicase
MAEKWVAEARRLINEKEVTDNEKKRMKQQSKLLDSEKKEVLEVPSQIDNICSVEKDCKPLRKKGPTIRDSYELAAGRSPIIDAATEFLLLEPSKDPILKQASSSNNIELKGPKIIDPDLLAPCSLVDDAALNHKMLIELHRKNENAKYLELLRKREQLPAYQMREQVVSAINQYRVTVISGDTGCGEFIYIDFQNALSKIIW